MSINSLTNDELRRSAASPQVTGITGGVNPAMYLAVGDVVGGSPPGPPDPNKDNRVASALNTLVKYIPTESVTLYIAAVSAGPALKLTFSFVNEKRLYWTFGVVLTPALLMLVYLGKRKVEKLQPLVPSFANWPWWKLIAASIAFLVWALAIPNNPYVNGVAQSAVVGFFALVISYVLTALEPFFES